MRQKISAIVLALAVVVLAGCGGAGTLSRTDAATMLKKSGVFEPIKYVIRVERICVVNDSGLDDGKSLEPLRQAAPFQDLGLIRIISSQPVQAACQGLTGRWVRIELTERGHAASKDWDRKGNTFTIQLTRPAKLEVTGISQGSDPNLMRVDYAVEYELTEAGRFIGLQLKPIIVTATFQRFDDGWRITDNGSGELNMTRR